MKKLSLLPIILLILSASCKKDIDNEDLNPKSYKIKVYRSNLIQEVFIYDKEYHLLSDTIYNGSNIGYSEQYVYYDDYKVKYVLRYNGSSSIADTFIYNYDGNNISYSSGPYSPKNLYYNPDNTLNKIEVRGGSCGCDYYYKYLSGNISSIKFDYPPGTKTDTMLYDNKINPFGKSWPHEITHPRFLSPNNITYHKARKVENINWNTGGPPIYHIVQVIKEYSYQYNSDDLPTQIIEYNLSTSDTINYQIEYTEMY